MNDDGKEEAEKLYEEDVKWIRDHVAPDDIYDFAQQILIGAEHLLQKLALLVDINKECEKDKQTMHWVLNIGSIEILKREGFKGILDVSWRMEKK